MNCPKLFNPKNYKETDFCPEVYNVDGVSNRKPSLCVLDDKEMLMFTCHLHMEDEAHSPGRSATMGRTRIQHTVIYRSHDGGKTWGKGKHAPFHGFEASATVIDGVIFCQAHMFPGEWSPYKACTAVIYRSDDKGETWSEICFPASYFGIDDEAVSTCPSRNFVKTKDGSIIIFIMCGNGDSYRLKSADNGLTWKADKAEDNIKRDRHRALICEGVTYITPSGRFMMATRVDPGLIHDETIPNMYMTDKSFDTDEGDTVLFIESKDEGLTWEAVRGVEFGAIMYPSIAYLDDKNFIFTYTQRETRIKTPYQHMGVQAVFGHENDDGSLDIDMGNDILVIDDRTPDYSLTGDGYGMITRLSDGSFIIPYSYRKNTESFNEIISSDAFKSDEIFVDYCYRAGDALVGKGPDLQWWHNFSDVWKRVLIHEYAEVFRESWFETQVLKFKIKGSK